MKKKKKTSRFVVYTALFGDKEPLGNPLAELPSDASTDIDIDFICFTDNRNLTSPVWKFEYLDGSLLPPEKFSRRPKALPHEYLPSYDSSLYIDNSVFLKRLPNSGDLRTDKPYLFRLFRHPTRTNIDEEADAIVLLRYEEEAHICEQMEFYRRLRQGVAATTLSTCTVILRNHLHPAVMRFGTAWWEQILAFSKRDQLSFDLCAARTGATVDHFSQKFWENDLFRWHSGGSAVRIYPNFDGKRYAWKHRADPSAPTSPRAHFLAHGAVDSPFYSRKVSLFEYVCHKQQSSLGSYVPPRRRIAASLGNMLAGRRGRNGKMLVLRIDDPSCPTGFAPEEHLPAAQALSSYLGKYETQHFELPRNKLAEAAAIFGPHIPSYEILAILGHAPEDLMRLQPLIERLASRNSAAVVLVATEAIDARTTGRLADEIGARLGTNCRLSLAPGDHDELEQAMANGVAVLEW